MNHSILTLNDFFNNLFQNHGDRPAVHFQNQSFTYRELHKQANRVAHRLINVWGKK